MSLTGKRKAPSVETRHARRKRLKREEQKRKGLVYHGKPVKTWKDIRTRKLLWRILSPTGVPYPGSMILTSRVMMQERFGDVQDAVTQDDLDRLCLMEKHGQPPRFSKSLDSLVTRNKRILFWVCAKYMGDTTVPFYSTAAEMVRVIGSFTLDLKEVRAQCDLMKNQLVREKEHLMQLMERATFSAVIMFRVSGYLHETSFATLRLSLTRKRRTNGFGITWIYTLKDLEDGTLPRSAVNFGLNCERPSWPPSVSTYSCSNIGQLDKCHARLPGEARVAVMDEFVDVSIRDTYRVIADVDWLTGIARVCMTDVRLPACLHGIVLSYMR